MHKPNRGQLLYDLFEEERKTYGLFPSQDVAIVSNVMPNRSLGNYSDRQQLNVHSNKKIFVATAPDGQRVLLKKQ